MARPEPILETPRLRLRLLAPQDASDIQRLAGDRRIAETTLRVPHPYPFEAAEELVAVSRSGFEKDRELKLAMVERGSGELCGLVSLTLNLAHDSGELGYWVGVPYWGRGYGSEAAQALVDHGFEAYGLHRIEAFCMTGNVASTRILEKVGMRREGTQRDGIKKGGVFHDTEMWAVLSSDRESRASTVPRDDAF